MTKNADDYRLNYTKVHMNRDVYEIAKANAKEQNRTIANYIAHLVHDDTAKINADKAIEAAQLANIPGSKVK